MTQALSPDDPLEGLPSRAKIAELILGGHPPRDTYVGWQHYRTHYGLLVPGPVISLQRWPMIPESRKADYDLYRQLTNANLPLQNTPMHDQVGKLLTSARQGDSSRSI
nr:hypothetical protein OG409_34585 [Streptomyces sp. NBC_00974]